MQSRNTGDGVLRFFVTISPMGTDAFANNADMYCFKRREL